MQHDWPLTLPWLEESRAAWKEMRSFVDERSRVAIGVSRVTYGHENGRATG